jgi:hypothetical protein
MVVELPVGYHLTNFLSLIRFVRSQYADLLTDEEKSYADDFESLSDQAQSLYVRMVSRRGPVFRSDKLSYVDVPDIEGSAAELSDAGYMSYETEEDELLDLHTKAELLDWMSDVAGAKQLKRDDLVELVKSEVDVFELEYRFEVYRPLGEETLLLYRLLFFGNLNQDFTEFVLTDMGMLRYEDYAIPEEVRLFDSREVIDLTWQLYEVREVCDVLLEEGEFDKLPEVARMLADMDSDLVSANPALLRRRDRLLNHIARHLERQEMTEDALEFYGQTSSPPGRERRARILKKAGEEPASLTLCEEIIADPADEEELEFAVRFGHQLAKKLHGSSDISQTVLDYETLDLELDRPEPSSHEPEEAARLWFEGQGDDCFYVENGLIRGLFGLCFWDIIFMPVKGAFVNPYQRGPLDLFTPSFREARSGAIDARFAELEIKDQLVWLAYETHKEKFGIANHFVSWDLLTTELMELALRRIPVAHLLAMFSRLMFDLRNNRSGFPDLITFPVDAGYCMVEVKGPGDQLQNNQKRWIKAFTANLIPFKLARVEWVD